MKLLADTHAVWWYIEGDPKLSATARTLMQNATNDILVSSASFWEIAIKISLGKWKLNRTYEEFIDLVLKKCGFQILPILPTHTAKIVSLPFHHKDPFDRMLVGQALVENISLVSSDSALDSYGITRHW